MSRHQANTGLPPAQLVAERVFSALERFLHVEAVGGVVLLAAAALIWANSAAFESYVHLWGAQVSVQIGSLAISQSLHFMIDDVLMPIFFLVAGLESRHD